jgi:O-antigen/teichoic acid export membrane protein
MNKSHVLSGIRWTLVTSVFRRMLTLVLFYFVARWLTKEDLGIFRTYCLILGLVSTFGTLSLDFHYIIEQKKSHTGLLALWQMAAVSSGLGIILLTALSGVIGILYKSPVLGNLFLYTSVFLLSEILRKTVRAMAARRQQFRELALAETYNVALYSVLSVLALYFIRSVWVYVVIFYLGNLLEAIYLWSKNSDAVKRTLAILIKQRKVLSLSLYRFRAFLTQATLVSVVNLFSGNAPILLLGLMIEPVYLGVYFFASQLIGVPVGMFNTAVNQVFFPVFAGKKDGDITAMAARYLRLVGNLGLPLLLLFTYVMMLAVSWLLGDKWSDAIPLLPAMFLLFGSSFYSNPIGGIPFIKRKPSWELTWNVASLVIKSGAMLWGLRYSFETAIWAFAIAAAVTAIAFYLMSMHLVKLRFSSALRNVLVSFLPVLVYTPVLIVISRMSGLLSVVMAVAAGGLLLAGLNVISKGKLKADIRMIVSGG